MIRLLARLFTIVALTVGVGVTVAPASSALIVPNTLHCNWANQCRQINGAFVSGIPVYCHRVLFLDGVPNRRISLCQHWY